MLFACEEPIEPTPEKPDQEQTNPDEEKPGDNNQGDENTGDENTGNENQEEINKPTAELSPAQQQAKFQSVGQEVLNEFPANEFENLAKIAEAFEKTYGSNENYDLTELEEWIDENFDVAYVQDHNHTSTEQTEVCINNIDFLLLLSNHTGLFTFGTDKVTVNPSYTGGTKAVFTVEGKTYEAEVSSSGKVTSAYFVYEYHSEWGYEYKYEGWKHDSKSDDFFQITVGVPENVNVSITENGSPLATVKAKFECRVTPDHFQVSTDALYVEFTASINGYDFKSSKTGFNGTAGTAEAGITVSRNGKKIVTSSTSADLKLKYETVQYDYESDDDYYSHYDHTTETQVIVDKLTNVVVNMDILGQIQIKGTCTDINKLNEEIDAVYDALRGYDDETGNSKPVDEVTAALHTEEINKLIDFGVYYDKGNNKQASLKFEHYYEEHYEEDEWGNSWGGASWGFYPIIVFNDGSQNKIEDFFTENAFGGLIESVEALAESYADVFGYFFEEEELPELDYEY